MKALIVYDTITGHTLRAAQDIAAGLEGEGVDVRIQAAGEMAEWDVADCEIVAVGSPCHAGSIAVRAGLSGPIRAALAQLGNSSLAGKTGGAFSVNSAYGGRRTVRAIEAQLRAASARIAAPGVVVKAGMPFSLFRGPMASDAARQQLRDLGRALATGARSADVARER